MPNMQQYREQIERALQEVICLEDRGYDPVIEAMRYAVLGGGKRIRGILVLEFCRMHGGSTEDALPMACAIECIHSYSLIHDDLPCMDDDDLRRGKPSCHKQFGESTALLAGDGLLTKAFELLATAPLAMRDPKAVLDCVGLLSKNAGIYGMIGGQVLDLQQEGKTITEKELRALHLLKTGALICVACQIGTRIVTEEALALQGASCFGEHLGLAFQLVDDRLDVVGNEQELGKPIGSDAANQKNTFVTLCGIEATIKMATEETRKALTVLALLPNSEFLQQVTIELLDRRS